MKKQRKQPHKPTRKAPTQTRQAAPQAGVSRRTLLRWLRNGAIAAPVVGVGGFFAVRAVEASICELDLSKVGNGRPSIVQIHDPQCPLCVTLQRQTRRALRGHDDELFHFFVANIQTVEGSSFAARHNVPHVTLLFFDGAGQRVNTLRGPVADSVVEAEVAAHLARHPA